VSALDVVEVLTGRRRADRRRWAQASSLADLCQVTTGWLRDEVHWCPGYYGRVDVDEAEGLLEALVAANRAGFLTVNSQEGFDGPGFDRARWQQCAWVCGFAPADLAVRLVGAAERAGYTAVVWTPAMAPVTVTWRAGQPYTGDAWEDPETITECLFLGVGPAALGEVLAAAQVTIIDPQIGRNELWAWLERTMTGFSAQVGGGS
jgi:hypothetical protein